MGMGGGDGIDRHGDKAKQAGGDDDLRDAEGEKGEGARYLNLPVLA